MGGIYGPECQVREVWVTDKRGRGGSLNGLPGEGMAPGLRSPIVGKEGSWGQAAVSTKETAISENAGPTRAVASPARLPEPVGRPWAPAYEASWHGLKVKRQCEPQRGRAPWLSAAPGGDWMPLLEAGAGA